MSGRARWWLLVAGVIVAAIVGYWVRFAEDELRVLNAPETVPGSRLSFLLGSTCPQVRWTDQQRDLVASTFEWRLGSAGEIEFRPWGAGSPLAWCKKIFFVSPSSYLQGAAVVRQVEGEYVVVDFYSYLDVGLFHGMTPTFSIYVLKMDPSKALVFDGRDGKLLLGRSLPPFRLRPFQPERDTGP